MKNVLKKFGCQVYLLIFKSPDGTEDWIIYHANPAPKNGQGCGATRSTWMQKFTRNADGTPDFGVPVATGVAMKVPSGE